MVEQPATADCHLPGRVQSSRTEESRKRSLRQSRKVAADVSLPSQCSQHQQANHAQCDRPSGRNRPSRKDRAPLLLRGSLPNILSYGER